MDSNTTSRKAKILAVEDDKYLASIYQMKLKNQGYNVELAANGEEGLEKAKIFKPDLILLDLMMPIMDGYSMLNELKKDPKLKNTKIIILTNLGQESDIQQAVNHGVLDYVVKTDTATTEIIDKIEKLLTN